RPRWRGRARPPVRGRGVRTAHDADEPGPFASHRRHRMRTTRSEVEGLPAAAGPVESSPNSSAPIANAPAPWPVAVPVAVPVVETLRLGEGVRIALSVEAPGPTA